MKRRRRPSSRSVVSHPNSTCNTDDAQGIVSLTKTLHVRLLRNPLVESKAIAITVVDHIRDREHDANQLACSNPRMETVVGPPSACSSVHSTNASAHTPQQSTAAISPTQNCENAAPSPNCIETPSPHSKGTPGAQKSPGSALLRQLQSNLSPKYMNTSTPGPDSRVSRYGRQQKLKETTDCLANDILAAVLRKSLNEVSASPSPPKHSTMTTPTKSYRTSPSKTIKKTPESQTKKTDSPSSIRHKDASVPTTATTDLPPIAANPNLIRSSPPAYVSPIQKLIMLNKRAVCLASDYVPSTIGSGTSTSETYRSSTSESIIDNPQCIPGQNAFETAERDHLTSRKTLSFDEPQQQAIINTADTNVDVVQVQPQSAQRKIITPRVASSGRAPVVAKIAAGGIGSNNGNNALPLHLITYTQSPRRNKLLPQAPLFSETVQQAPATNPATGAITQAEDIEHEIISFTVHKSPATEPTKDEAILQYDTSKIAEKSSPTKDQSDSNYEIIQHPSRDLILKKDTMLQSESSKIETLPKTVNDFLKNAEESIDSSAIIFTVNKYKTIIGDDNSTAESKESTAKDAVFSDLLEVSSVPSILADTIEESTAILPLSAHTSDGVGQECPEKTILPPTTTSAIEPPANVHIIPSKISSQPTKVYSSTVIIPLNAKTTIELDDGSFERCASVDSAKGSSIVTEDDRQSTGTDATEIGVIASTSAGMPATSWREGQVAWAKIGNYPYWPCIVCTSPEGRLLSSITSECELVWWQMFQ